jgi:hypothetical protein
MKFKVDDIIIDKEYPQYEFKILNVGDNLYRIGNITSSTNFSSVFLEKQFELKIVFESSLYKALNEV